MSMHPTSKLYFAALDQDGSLDLRGVLLQTGGPHLEIYWLALGLMVAEV